MNTDSHEHRDHGFVLGLLTGTIVGGLAMWLVPRLAAECQERVTDSARNLGQQASATYQQTSARVVEAVDDLTRRGQDVRDEVAETVARGARKVERFATAAKSE